MIFIIYTHMFHEYLSLITLLEYAIYFCEYFD